MNKEKIAKYLRNGCGIESLRRMTIPAKQNDTIKNMIKGPEESMNAHLASSSPILCMARKGRGILTKT